MTGLLAKAFNSIRSLLNNFQVKQFFAIVLVGFLLLSTASPEQNAKAVTKKIQQDIHQGNSQRPKTTGEWNREARETEDAPGERLERITKQSGEALKDWGEVYPDTAQRSNLNDLQEDTAQAGKSFFNRDR